MAKRFNSSKLKKILVFSNIVVQLQFVFLIIIPVFTRPERTNIHGKYFPIIYDTSSTPVSNTLPSLSNNTNTSLPEIRIFVNLDTLRLYVYKNSKLCEYLFVSGGHNETQTPLGTFTLNINENAISFSTPNKDYNILSTMNSEYQNEPTGIVNFSQGDLYLSHHDFLLLTKALTTPAKRRYLTIHSTKYPWQTLKEGMFCQDVLTIQQYLYALGYYSGVNNGFFCSKTKSAIVAFQKDACLFPTGIVNYATYRKILQRFSSHNRPYSA